MLQGDKDLCVICRAKIAETKSNAGDNTHQNCSRCGEFKASDTASSQLDQELGSEKRAKISGWVREQSVAGNIPMLTSDILERELARPLPSVMERAEGLLLEARRGQTKIGERFNVSEPRFLASSYSSDGKEVTFLVRLLKELEMMKSVTMGSTEITPGGYIHADEITRKPVQSNQGFVAMWFKEEMKEAYDSGFGVGISKAGYDPLVMNRLEHINRIDDEIIAQIKVSRFIVADFTGHRGGVYFEAGFALGLDIPIIWTCRKDDMDDLHFDIRQFNCIFWETPFDLADSLQKRLENVIGVGAKKVPE